MALTREEILAAVHARRIEVVKIDVPEWGGDVYVRRLTPGEVDRSGIADGKRDATLFAKVLAISLCDEEAALLFGDDGEALIDVDISVAAQVFGEIMRVNGLMDEELEAALSVFTHAQNGPSSSS